MRIQDRTVEREIARIAGAQEGVVARVQLLAAGITASGIARRLRKGSLLHEFRGVYRAGHRAPSARASYMAAVLACGDGAMLHGLAAGWLHGLLKGPAPAPEVTAPTERRIPGVRTRRSRALEPRDATFVGPIPVTSVAATLVDLAAVLGPDALARACHEAAVVHRVGPAEVEAALKRRPKSKGARKLRRILRGDTPLTLSRLERRFLALLRANRLPLPEVNRPAGGLWVDCRWPEQRLTVELDGYRYHHTRHAWEQDRRRRRKALARGDEFRSYTWGDVFEAPRQTVAEVKRLLAESRPA